MTKTYYTIAAGSVVKIFHAKDFLCEVELINDYVFNDTFMRDEFDCECCGQGMFEFYLSKDYAVCPMSAVVEEDQLASVSTVRPNNENGTPLGILAWEKFRALAA